jgi:branched-chain amino acid transport system permease protein
MGAQLVVNGISIGAVYALFAAGFALVFGVLKFSNLAHGGVVSASAYAGFIFQLSIDPTPPFWLTALFTCFAGMFFTFLVDMCGFYRLRKKNADRLFFFLASVTCAILIEQLLIANYGTMMYAFPPLFQPPTMSVLGITISRLHIMILIIAVVMLSLLIFLIEHTKLGLAIRAVAINTRVSQLMGVNSSRVVTITLIIAGFLAGITGLMLGVKYSVFPALGPSVMLKGLIASVIGGLGSLSGTIFAAIMLGIIEIICIFFWGAEITPLLLFGIMMIFLMVRPQGIAGRFSHDKV